MCYFRQELFTLQCTTRHPGLFLLADSGIFSLLILNFIMIRIPQFGRSGFRSLGSIYIHACSGCHKFFKMNQHLGSSKMVYVHGAWCIRGWGGPLRGNSVLIPHRVSRKAAPPSLPHLLGSAKPTLFWMRPTPGIALSDVPWENFIRIIYSRCMYDATIINIIVWMEIMTSIIIKVKDAIIIIRVWCDHHHYHHPCTMGS